MCLPPRTIHTRDNEAKRERSMRDRFAALVAMVLILFGYYAWYMAGVEDGKQYIITETVIEKQSIVIPVEVGLFDSYKELRTGNITPDYAIEALLEGLKIHRSYIEHPENCNEIVGSREWHLRWMKIYEGVISLIRELE